MRISDWSSDVCSSDLDTAPAAPAVVQTEPRETIEGQLSQERTVIAVPAFATPSVTTVAGLRTDTLGGKTAEVTPATPDGTGPSRPPGPGAVGPITMARVTPPRFAAWTARNARNVVRIEEHTLNSKQLMSTHIAAS